MIYTVRHLTVVEYAAPVQLARFNLRLKPVAWPGQWTSGESLTIDPQPRSMESALTAWPVNVVRLVIEGPLQKVSIESRFRAAVGTEVLAPDAGDLTIGAVADAVLVDRDMSPMAPAHYLYASPRVPLLEDIARWTNGALSADRPVVQAGLDLACRIKSEFAYIPFATDASTPVAEAFEKRHGVCQDFAHIMVAALRLAGLPAAYVSGYLRTDPPEGMPRLVGADAMHAWVMLWCGPTRGWIGFDPTNGCITGSDHVFIAMGRDYADVAPIDGLFVGGAGQQIQAAVDVIPETEAVPG